MRIRIQSRITTAVMVVSTLAVARCADGPILPPADIRVEAGKPISTAATADPIISGTNPTAAPQDTTLDVTVSGSNFSRGSSVTFGVAGTPNGQVVTNSTRYVSQRELRANISIAADASVGSYDVIVTTAEGRKGIGTEMFAVKKKIQLATLTVMPTLGANSDALAANEAGTIIVGHSFDPAGYLYAVRWVMVNGAWTISKLPFTGSARAMGVNNQGDIAGYFASFPRYAVLWFASGSSIKLGCATDVGEGTASAIAANARVVVGSVVGVATVWRDGECKQSLPSVTPTGSSYATTVNGDGTVIGGSASLTYGGSTVPVRWRLVEGVWQIEQLDTRAGRVGGSNAAGDLVGSVAVPCAVTTGCNRVMIWYIGGGSRQLPTLNTEQDQLYGTDINGAGEVVGRGSSSNRNVAFFWSASIGMIELPAKAMGAGAWTVAEQSGDGTRLVIGGSGSVPYVWVVRNP
jgi:hypothetical protein